MWWCRLQDTCKDWFSPSGLNYIFLCNTAVKHSKSATAIVVVVTDETTESTDRCTQGNQGTNAKVKPMLHIFKFAMLWLTESAAAVEWISRQPLLFLHAR